MTNQDTFGYVVGDNRSGFHEGTATLVIGQNAGPSLNLTWASLTDGQVHLWGSGIPERSYVVEFSESLASPLWQTLGTVETDALGVFDYLDQPPARAPARFYRTICP